MSKQIKVIKQTALLESESRIGKKKFWRKEAVQIGKDFFVRSEYWQVSKDGKEESKHTFATPHIVKPTNVGRANERNAKEQALFQLESDFKKQMDSGYHLVGKKIITEVILPMKANKFFDIKKNKEKKISYPVYGQYKFNGVRDLNKSSVGSWSRKGKFWDERCVEHLKFDTKGLTVDGELMLPHANNTFQESMAAVKKFRTKDEIIKGVLKPASKKLHYYIYDVVIEGMGFKERYAELKKLSKSFPKQVHLAKTVLLKNRKEVEDFLDKAIDLGYEGIILRTMDGEYEINNRSNSLLKYKRFIDEEFEIVDIVSGEGRDKGCAIFICKTKKGLTFKVNPEGSDAKRREYYRDRKKLIGKLATVRFQAWTDEGKPYIATMVEVRDYE